MTIQHSRPAKAESLLYTAGCAVKSLLGTKCPAKKSPPAEPTQPANPGSTTPSDKSGDPSDGDGSGSTNTSGTKVPEPLTIDDEKLSKLPQVKELEPAMTGNGAGYTANVLPTISGYQQPGAVLGAMDIAALQTTDQGWKIAGVLWYWWLAAIAAIIGLALVLKATLLKSFFTIAKPH